MKETQLSLTNVIRVTLSGVERGREARNVNDILLITNEPKSTISQYDVFVDPNSVATLYGTTSTTAAMANAIFAQTPNILTGRGRLIVMPTTAVGATQAEIETTDISANIAAFKLVTDGSLKISVGSNSYEVTGLNFANISSDATQGVIDIATILQNAFPQVYIASGDSKVLIVSKKFGAVTLTVEGGATGTDISGSSYLNVDGGTTTAGTDASGETLIEAFTRAKTLVQFGGVATTYFVDDAQITDFYPVVQANDCIFVNVWCSQSDIMGACRAVQLAGATQTRCLVYTNTTNGSEAKNMLAAYIGRNFSTNFSGSNTAQTANLKTLATITPDYGISQTDYENAKDSGVDLYTNYEGTPATLGTVANQSFESVYEGLALKFNLIASGFNALKTIGTKVPQTEQGMTQYKSSLAKVMEMFVTNGVIGVGLQWNSAQTFGDPEIFRENITNQGWYMYSQPVALQLQTEREQGLAPLVQIAYKRSGAIRESDVVVIFEE